MSAPSVFDDLPPDVLEAVAAQVAEAFAAGHAAGVERGARDIPKVWQLGYDAGQREAPDRYWTGYADAVAMMTGAEEGEVDEVDAEVLAAVDRLARRYKAEPKCQTHKVTLVRHRAGR